MSKNRVGVMACGQSRVEVASKDDNHFGLHDPLVAYGLNIHHGLKLVGEVEIVIPHNDTSGHDKLAMEVKRACAIEEGRKKLVKGRKQEG